MTSRGYVVGVDAGGTKTHLRVADATGATVDDIVLPSDAWKSLPADEHARAIIDLLVAAGWGMPSALGIGAHGCDSDDECEQLRADFVAMVSCPVVVVNDAVLLQHVVGEARGANLVLGTGSIVVATTAAGETLYAGGWGWLIGDPGSAWGIVRESVKLLAARADAGAADDLLLAALCEHTGLASLHAVVDHMQRVPATDWAAWAPLVFDAAGDGSAAARAAIDDGARSTISLVRQLIDRGAAVTSVVTGGGVITHQPVLQEAIGRRLHDELGLELIVVRDPPVAGAVHLAQSLLAAPSEAAAGGRAT